MKRLLCRRLLVSVFTLALLCWAGIPAAQASSASIGQNILNSGMKYIGVPYKYGADPNQTSTFDCSSFTRRAFLENGITLPRTSQEQFLLGQSVTLDQAQPGDLVFYHDAASSSVPDHVGIYMGNRQMINATVTKGVEVVDISTPYWTSRFLGVKRVIPSTYTVVSGDALWKISSKTGVPIDSLVSWNHLNSEALNVGQTLFIANPNLTVSVNAPQRDLYAVKAGDMLWMISQKTGVSIADLKAWNQLTSDMIYVGQLLYLDPPAVSYTVQAGDTLYKLSQKYGVTVDQMRQTNHLITDSINIGQTLLIPYT